MRGIITLRDCIVSHFYVRPIVGFPHWTNIDWREWHSKREKIEQYALGVLRRCKWNWTNRNGNWECFKWVRYWVCGYACALCVDRQNGHANATQWWVSGMLLVPNSFFRMSQSNNSRRRVTYFSVHFRFTAAVAADAVHHYQSVVSYMNLMNNNLCWMKLARISEYSTRWAIVWPGCEPFR